MASSDFNIDENDNSYSYDNQIQSNKRNVFSNAFINDPNIVYDENIDSSFLGKVKYYFSTINRSLIVFLLIMFVVLAVVIGIVIAVISGYNNSYKTKITIPNVVYIGETATISAISEGTGNVSKTKVTFTTNKIKDEESDSSDDSEEEYYEAPLELLSNEMRGEEVYNTLIPIQEGGISISVKSRLGTRNMGDVQKNVYVCPRFSSNLVSNGIISIAVGSDTENQINFGPGDCSKGIKYKSSNNDIFAVDKNGKISGLKSGTANLIVTKGERSFSIPVQVTNDIVYINQLKVEPKKIQLVPGENRRLNVSYLPTNANTSKIKFDTNDYDVASVNDYGVVEAKKPGTANISIKATDSENSGSVEIVVSKLKSEKGSIVTDLELDKEEVNLVQGESLRINSLIYPDDAKNKVVKYVSSDDKIASVNSKGIIYAKNAGDVTVTASTNNSILKTVTVNVTSITRPTVLSDDGIIENNWHNRSYKLKLSGGGYGATYYYGTNQERVDKKVTEIDINKEGSNTIYTKACLYNLCGPTIATLTKLDSVKPKILKVVTRDNPNTGNTSIYAAAMDKTSMISSWCISKVDNYRDCKWLSISPIKNPVLSSTLTDYSSYYVFVKDGAGNISNSMEVKGKESQGSSLD